MPEWFASSVVVKWAVLLLLEATVFLSLPSLVRTCKYYWLLLYIGNIFSYEMFRSFYTERNKQCALGLLPGSLTL